MELRSVGGDMTFVGNTLYIINQTRQLYTATTAGGAGAGGPSNEGGSC
mgnify:CR=1 FL=1